MVYITATAEKLRPCPFCGSGALQGHVQGVYWTGCFNVKCPIKPKAISTCNSTSMRKWNQRMEDAE